MYLNIYKQPAIYVWVSLTYGLPLATIARLLTDYLSEVIPQKVAEMLPARAEGHFPEERGNPDIKRGITCTHLLILREVNLKRFSLP